MCERLIRSLTGRNVCATVTYSTAHPPEKRRVSHGRAYSKRERESVPTFPPRKPDRARGEVNPNRIASARICFGDFVVYRNPTDPEQDIEEGDNISLQFPNPRGGSIYHKLTSLTRAELDAVRLIFETACNEAEAIVDARDKTAAESLARGEDKYTRIYRAAPHVIIKKTTKEV